MATLAEHCQNLYSELEKQAAPRDIKGKSALVFEGSLLQAFRNTGISQSYYTKVYRTLETLGAITIIARGGRNEASMVALFGAPEPAELDLTPVPSPARILSRIEAIEQRLGNIESQLGGFNIKEAFLEVQGEIAQIRGNIAEEPQQP